MTSRQIQTWARAHMLPRMPGWRAVGNKLVVTPIGWVLQYCVLERSCDPTMFSHIDVGVMPLWQVFPAVALTFSVDVLTEHRNLAGPILSGSVGPRFGRLAEHIKEQAPGVLGRIGTVKGFRANAEAFLRETSADADVTNAADTDDLLAWSGLNEHLAGAAVLCGDAKEAVACADRVIARWGTSDDEVLQGRVQRMRQLKDLAKDDLTRAADLLRQWRSSTLAAIRLQDHAVPEDALTPDS